MSIGYTGLTGSNLGWGGSDSGTASLININQLDLKYQQVPGFNPLQQVANPFFGIAAAGQFAGRKRIELGQLLRPCPQFTNATCCSPRGRGRSPTPPSSCASAWSVSGAGNISYTYSRLNDNQFGQANYYSSAPGLQNNDTVGPTRRTTTPTRSTVAACWTRRTSW